MACSHVHRKTSAQRLCAVSADVLVKPQGAGYGCPAAALAATTQSILLQLIIVHKVTAVSPPWRPDVCNLLLHCHPGGEMGVLSALSPNHGCCPDQGGHRRPSRQHRKRVLETVCALETVK